MLALFVLLHGMLFLHWVVSLRLAKTSFPVVFFSLPAIVPDEYYDPGYKQILVKVRDWTRFVKAPICLIIQLLSSYMSQHSVIRTYDS